MKLPYLADIYHHLNNLNTSMRGTKENILTSTDKPLAFNSKLAVWKKHIAKRKRRNVSTPTSNLVWIWKYNSINCKSFMITVRKKNLISTSPSCHQIRMTWWETPSLSSHQVQKIYLVCKKRKNWVNYSATEHWKWNLMKYHLTSFGF